MQTVLCYDVLLNCGKVCSIKQLSYYDDIRSLDSIEIIRTGESWALVDRRTLGKLGEVFVGRRYSGDNLDM